MYLMKFLLYMIIYGDCLKDDKRAITEYNIALQEFQNRFYSEQQNDEVKLVKKFRKWR